MSDEIEHDKPDTITRLRAEVERLKVENEAVLSANRDVMLHWDILKADYEKLRAALMAELADHEEAIAHDRGGLEYASLVGIPISNADSLAQSVRYHESRAKLIRAALEEKQ